MQNETPEALIRATASVVTLINMFTVDPANQQQLVKLWQRTTDEVMRHQPGFVSASIHRSYDGTKVINYAQWESRDAFAAMFQNPQASAHLTKLAEIGTPDPVLCEVVSVHTAPAQTSHDQQVLRQPRFHGGTGIRATTKKAPAPRGRQGRAGLVEEG